MSDDVTYSGTAAMSICEALLLVLNNAHVLTESEHIGFLDDAAASRRRANGSDVDLEKHESVAELIDRIIADGNSVRRA